MVLKYSFVYWNHCNLLKIRKKIYSTQWRSDHCFTLTLQWYENVGNMKYSAIYIQLVICLSLILVMKLIIFFSADIIYHKYDRYIILSTWYNLIWRRRPRVSISYKTENYDSALIKKHLLGILIKVSYDNLFSYICCFSRCHWPMHSFHIFIVVDDRCVISNIQQYTVM